MLPVQWVEESGSWNSFPDVGVIPCMCGDNEPERYREETLTIESRSCILKSYGKYNKDITHKLSTEQRERNHMQISEENIDARYNLY